jgi:murein DD-endopeptidase MepM/ murein hydrolase activator NlpD
MKKIYQITMVLLMILPFLFSCKKDKKDDVPKEEEPVTEVSVGDSIRVNFPSGSIRPGKVTLTTVKDQETLNIFNETADFFQVSSMLPYQIVLNTGTQVPNNDSVSITIKIPPYLLSKKESTTGFQLFARLFQDGGEEALDYFILTQSQYQSSDNTITANIPVAYFSNVRTSDNTYEAVFIVGITPGENITNLSASASRRKSGVISAVGGTGSSVCGASQIPCAIGTMDDCKGAVTSIFGMRKNEITGVMQLHMGIDLGVNLGTSVSAVSNGTVIRAKDDTRTLKGKKVGFGLYVALKHTDGSTSVYAHLSSYSVKVGDVVRLGQEIGKSGNTGGSTNPHLHLEYYPNGYTFLSGGQIDPLPCISDGNVDGSITVRDNGNLADDAFDLYLDDILLGSTQIGASNSIAVNGLRPGTKVMKLSCTIAPDNVGTYEVILNNGITFSDGSVTQSGVIGENASISWDVIIPMNLNTTSNIGKMKMNTIREEKVGLR